MSTHILLFSSYHLDIFEIVYMLCIYVCMFAYMWALMCECGGLRLTRAMLGIFLDCSPHCLLRWGLSLNLNLAFASALDSQLASEMPCLLPKDCDYWQAIMPTQLLCGLWDPNSGPVLRFFLASTLSTGPSPQPYYIVFC